MRARFWPATAEYGVLRPQIRVLTARILPETGSRPFSYYRIMPSARTPSPATDDLAAWLRQLDFAIGEPLGQSNQGEVRRFRTEDWDLAVKTPSGRGLLRWMRLQSLRREYKTYRQLDGLSGFAPCHGLFGDRYLVLDYVDGEDFRTAALPDRDAFFDHLLEIIRAMHARGVAHGDLKRKDNLRVNSHGQPVILDLGTAVYSAPGAGPLNRKVFDFARQTDLNAWVKLKHGSYRDVPEPDGALLQRSWLERGLGRLRRR